MLGGSAGGSLALGLPDGLLRQAVLPFLAVEEVVRLQSAVCICEPQDKARLLSQISGAVLEGSLDFILSDASVAWLLRTRVGVRNASVYWSKGCGRCLENFGAAIAGDVLGHLVALRVVDEYPVSKLFQYCSKLRSLDLSKQHSDWAGKDTPHAVATHCTGLLALDLSYTPASSAWVIPLAQRCSLTSLRLHDIEISDFTDESIARLSEHCPDLVELALPLRADFTHASAGIIAQNCPALQILDVSGCWWLSDEWIIPFSQHCKELRELRMVYGVFSRIHLTDAGITALSLNCTELEVLNISCCEVVSDVGILELASNCPHLQSLNVSGCSVSDQSIVAVAQRCRGLRMLSMGMGGCLVGDAAIIALSLHCTGLQSLSIQLCDDMTEGAIVTLARRCTDLRQLEINASPVPTDALLVALTRNCPALERLVLSGCEGVTDAAIYNLALSCGALQHLWVDRDEETLSEALMRRCPHLKVSIQENSDEEEEGDEEDEEDDEEEEEEDEDDAEEEAEADDGN